MKCAKCQTDNGDTHRFCHACGAALQAAAATTGGVEAPRQAGGERRQLTVMFCDIVDSTPLSLQFDPEDLREIIRIFQDACVAVIERYDGFIAQHLGDGLLVYFGYPRAHEDDGLRAVHVGLGVIDAVRELRPRPGLELQVRVGIATGKVVIGELVSTGAQTERVAVGPTPHLAARLQSIAAPNTVVISPQTHQLLGQSFEIEDIGVRELKGIPEPVWVRQVIGPSARQSRFAAAQGATTLPLVGRDAELRMLRQLCARAVQGDGQVVLIRGEPGIGKSRLMRAHAEELCAKYSILPVELQCSPYHTHSALYPVLEWWQVVFSSHGAVGDAEKLRVVKTLVARAGLDAPVAVPCLAEFLALPVPASYGKLNLTADLQKRLTFQYLARLLRQLYPLPLVLLVIEDLHWADPSTLELVGLWLADAPRSRTFTLLTARPEFEPGWGLQANIATLDLGRLPDSHALELVSLAAGHMPLGEHVKQQLLRKTDCIPLYLEMLTRHFIDHAAVATEAGQTQGQADLLERAIPESLQDALMSRLDRMGETKSVAQLAAILGRDFDRALLEAAWIGSSAAVAQGLAELERADLIQLRGDRSHGQYRFKHALIRDVAYESLLKRNCETLHRHIAEVMEQRFPELAARQPDMLAQHFTAGRKIDAAISYWLAAGRLAMKNSATQEAVAHLRRGLLLLAEAPPSREREMRELDFQVVLGHALMTWKGYAAEEVRTSCARLAELCASVGNTPLLPAALYLQVAYNIVSANLSTALEAAEQLHVIALHVEGDDLLVESDVTRGVTQFFRGELDESRRALERCASVYDFERHSGHAFVFGHDPAVLALVYLIWIHWLQGRQADALDASNRAIALARRLCHPLSLAFALTFAGWHRVFSRDDAGARELSRELVEFCTHQNITIFLAHGHMIGAWLDCEQNRLAAGLQGMQSALDIFRLTGAQHFLPYWEAHQAMVRAMAGDASGAEALMECCIETANRTGEQWSQAELHRYLGLVLEHAGRPSADVEACFLRAVEVARSQHAVAWEARARLDLARHRLAAGRPGEARAVLEELRGTVPMDIDVTFPGSIDALLDACRTGDHLHSLRPELMGLFASNQI
ncbi:adenylate/guanylate cyclase domain-containing protein [Roseateles cellulosilyticus]|uniref:AAA family ATPase n=1 Tax=Pelomonas cellulosilytica TaxID=2906762 RepID=A0ABS8XPG8_9BURK|nr:adenylate/guanylate cyclase domain-containing protein [Pelomonas sp. P8]MCE4554651.1 AAA family ATPase [Pelomonas sp. P8]